MSEETKENLKEALTAAAVIGLTTVAVGGLTYLACNHFGSNSAKDLDLSKAHRLQRSSNGYKPRVVISDEVKVDHEIVGNLTDAAKSIYDDIVTSTDGKVKPKITVYSNMTSHPNSGGLDLEIKNKNPLDYMDKVTKIAEKHMNQSISDHGDNWISF